MNTDKIMNIIIGVVIIFAVIGSTWGDSVASLEAVPSNATGRSLLLILPIVTIGAVIVLVYKSTKG